MIALLLAAALAQAPASPPARRTTDVATIPVDDDGAVRPDAALAGLPDAELDRRIAALRRQNARSFSDRRSLQIQALEAEKERRRHESAWDEEEKAKRAREEAAAARAEAEFQVSEVRNREADEAATRAMAAARARAEEEARVEAELKAREQRDALTRWIALGAALAAAGIGAAVVVRRRRG
jgi:hypothetical protein